MQKAAEQKKLSAEGERRLLTDKMQEIITVVCLAGKPGGAGAKRISVSGRPEQAVHPTPRAKSILLVRAIGEEELLHNFVEEHPVLHEPPDSTTLMQYQEAVATLKELYHMSNERLQRALEICQRDTLGRYLNA